MTVLIVGIIIFFAIHLLPSLSSVRNSLISRLGKGGYMGLFAGVSWIGLGAIVWGKSIAEFVPVYEPLDSGRSIAMIATLLAFVFLASFLLKGRIKKQVRHPMMIALILWAGGHLAANGDLASILLFGSFLVYAITGIMLANARSSASDFTIAPRHDLYALGAGLAAYVLVVFAHPWLFGVAIV